MFPLNTLLGVLLAFGIGALCRWSTIPLPAPPTITGALIILMITLGYLAGSYWE